MKRFFTEYFPAWILLFILGFIVVHAPFTVYVSSHWPALAMYVKAWKEILLLVALLCIAMAYALRGSWSDVLRDRVVQLSLIFVAIHLVLALFTRSNHHVIAAGLMIDLRFVAYFLAVYLFLKLYPSYLHSFMKIGLMGACIVAGFALIQLFLPHDFLKYFGYSEATIQPYLTVDKNPDFVRQNSTLRGPNPLGAYAVMVLSGVVAYGVAIGRTLAENRKKYLCIFLGVAGTVSLWVSYSRSALVAGILAVLIVLVVWYRSHITRRVVVYSLLVGLLALVGLFTLRDSYIVKNVLVHDNPATGAAIDSNAGHAASLQEGMIRVLRQPLGAGIGSTGSASLFGDKPMIIENQYLFVAHESGWLGLMIFIILSCFILYRLWLRRNQWWALGLFASGIGLNLVGLLLPVWTDDTVSLVWWGLAAAALAWEKKGKNRGTTTNKKAKRTT